MTAFALIKQARQAADSQATIVENINYLAKQEQTTSKVIYESITHVLAGLAQNPNMMNPNSVAALMAGVEKLAGGLVSSQDDQRKQGTLKTLAGAAIKNDQMTRQQLPNQAVVKIAQFGAKFPDLVQKYSGVMQNPNQAAQLLKQLQMKIDRAMQQSQQSTRVSDNPAAMGSASQPSQNRPAQATRSAPATQSSQPSGFGQQQ